MNRINRVEERHLLSQNEDLSYTYIVVYGIFFMVSIGANPITSIWDEKQFPIGSKWLSIKRRKWYYKKQKGYAPILERTD